jgi:hypothetical protein
VLINKADGDLLGVAKGTKADYASALSLFRPKYPGVWRPRVCITDRVTVAVIALVLVLCSTVDCWLLVVLFGSGHCMLCCHELQHGCHLELRRDVPQCHAAIGRAAATTGSSTSVMDVEDCRGRVEEQPHDASKCTGALGCRARQGARW